MTRDKRVCPKCHGEMSLGHFIDFPGSGVWPSMWVAEADGEAVWANRNKDVKGYYASAFRCDNFCNQ